ncbi:murein L,D-transpeptidase family protein [uncultured Rhodoblastus sp.]|uniref:L,D-transpeptidase family protein n=1 Tax=uncultured Rhodoblastus sp. TaxID=543037 RepID=UPI0025E9CE9B|nr:murein L,D-transpeptidase family protein [uncultured Rhodoblastus sp.]
MSGLFNSGDLLAPGRLRKAAVAGVALGALGALGGCNDARDGRAMQALSSETLALMAERGVAPNAPILIRAFKKESELEVWKMRPDGTYVLLKTFPICRWSGQLGPKTHEGDRQSPEGFYTITPAMMNPNSSYYLSFNVGYPNAYDRAHGATGGSVMVHGVCSSSGCFSMTDAQIAEIYAIARESFAGGQRGVQMQAYPFHLTPKNLAKYRLDPNMPFWKELKKGHDHFEATKQDVAVGVCGRHYVFDAQPANGQRMDPEAACPPLKTDPEIEARASARERADEAAVAELVARGTPPVRLVYQDGAQHPVFAHRIADVSRPEALVPPTELALDDPNPRWNAKAQHASTALAIQLAQTQTRVVGPSQAPPEPQAEVQQKARNEAEPLAAARAEGSKIAAVIGAFGKGQAEEVRTAGAAQAASAEPNPAQIAARDAARNADATASVSLPDPSAKVGAAPAAQQARAAPVKPVQEGKPAGKPAVKPIEGKHQGQSGKTASAGSSMRKIAGAPAPTATPPAKGLTLSATPVALAATLR